MKIRHIHVVLFLREYPFFARILPIEKMYIHTMNDCQAKNVKKKEYKIQYQNGKSKKKQLCEEKRRTTRPEVFFPFNFCARPNWFAIFMSIYSTKQQNKVFHGKFRRIELFTFPFVAFYFIYLHFLLSLSISGFVCLFYLLFKFKLFWMQKNSLKCARSF